jgi:integrase
MADIRPRKGKKGTTYQLRYTDAAGEVRYKSFDRRKDAAAFLQNGTKEVTPSNENAGSLGPTLENVLDTWLHVCQHIGRNGREPVEPHTLRHYRTEANHIRALVDDAGKPFVARLVGSLTSPDMVKIQNALLAKHPRHTAKRCLTSLKSALAEAETSGDLAKIPGKNVKIVMGSRHKPQLIIPEPSDVQDILWAAYEASVDDYVGTREAWQRYRALVETIAFSGLRPSEARGLPRSNVRIAQSQIVVTQRADEKGTIGPPKTKAGFRTIDLPQSVTDLLAEWLELIPRAPDALVFGNGAGKAESLANITNRCWWPVVRRAKLFAPDGSPKFTLYSLRHFRASTEIALGANLKDIQELMGHESAKVTLDTYGHLFKDAESLRGHRARRLDAIFATTSPQIRPQLAGED